MLLLKGKHGKSWRRPSGNYSSFNVKGCAEKESVLTGVFTYKASGFEQVVSYYTECWRCSNYLFQNMIISAFSLISVSVQ